MKYMVTFHHQIANVTVNMDHIQSGIDARAIKLDASALSVFVIDIRCSILLTSKYGTPYNMSQLQEISLNRSSVL